MKILVVEDEHKIANSIKQGLEQENYTVDVAYNGEDGLGLAVTEEYDVIILDRLLPIIEGVEVLKQLRAKKNHTSVLILTAKGQVEDKIEGLNSGADDYLAKPFAFTELLARVKALSRRPKNIVNSTFKINDLTLNSKTFEVERAGNKIKLSNKEFSLLEYLLRHAGQIIKKEQIMNNVWNYDSDVLPNSVEVYIKHLRDKVDKPFKKSANLIHTIRGFGYKIE